LVLKTIVWIEALPLSLNLFLDVKDRLIESLLLLFFDRKFLLQLFCEIVDEVFLFLEFVKFDDL
jgi:hypothetical protein